MNKEYGHEKFGFKDLKKLEDEENIHHFRFSHIYDNKIENERDVVVSLYSYLKKSIEAFLPEDLSLPNESAEEQFWKYLNKEYFNKDGGGWYTGSPYYEHLFKDPELLVKRFKESYLENESLQLHYLVETEVNSIDFPFFDFVVNVGTRSYTQERSGWTTNSFTVFNKGIEYRFSNSTKDESLVRGFFANIFIPQFEKRRLLKLSISLSETSQTPFLIQKDLEKITIKNSVEVLISKHHGNETIIFDTKEEALKFQDKVLEIREGRRERY